MRAFIVAGLAFGDEGKGTVVDYLTRKHKAALVVRFNGGPQAAHNVVTPGGVHHTFAQFGAGTLAGARTYLSRHMLIEPYAMLNEAAVLAPKIDHDPFDGLLIDPNCRVITPYHIAANRALEASRGSRRHGSVGMGVGQLRDLELNHNLVFVLSNLDDQDEAEDILAEILKHYLRAGILVESKVPTPKQIVEDYLLDWRPKIRTCAWEYLAGAFNNKPVVFEGAQGFMLDELWGMHPHNSWTDCTFNNAVDLVEEAVGARAVDGATVRRIGVVRSYYTRHGAGPFPTQDSAVAPGVERHNGTHPWMGDFRTGHFDGVLFGYACDRAMPTDIVVTHTDVVSAPKIAVSYQFSDGYLRAAIPTTLAGTPALTAAVETAAVTYGQIHGPHRFFDWIRERTGVPVVATFRGPTHRHAEDLVAEREIDTATVD